MSDQGFRQQVVRQLLEELEIRKVTTTGYHPQCNGLTERFNRTLATLLALYVNEEHTDWDKYIKYAVFAYNTSQQATLKATPFYLMYGRYPRLPSDIHLGVISDHRNEFMPMLVQAREAALTALEQSQEASKIRYDEGHKEVHYNVGDKILLYHPRGYIGQTSKFIHKFQGPMEIMEQTSPVNYKIKRLNCRRGQARTETVHVSRIKPYFERIVEEEQVNMTEETQIIPSNTMKTIGLVTMSITILMMFTPTSTEAINEIVWRPTNQRVFLGSEHVTLYIQHILPCNETHNIITTDPNYQIIAQHPNFRKWCAINALTKAREDFNSICEPTQLSMEYAEQEKERLITNRTPYLINQGEGESKKRPLLYCGLCCDEEGKIDTTNTTEKWTKRETRMS